MAGLTKTGRCSSDSRFWTTLQEPDVWIMDPHSGEPLVKFRTGTAQDQIAFSKDGSLIYVINDYLYLLGSFFFSWAQGCD